MLTSGTAAGEPPVKKTKTAKKAVKDDAAAGWLMQYIWLVLVSVAASGHRIFKCTLCNQHCKEPSINISMDEGVQSTTTKANWIGMRISRLIRQKMTHDNHHSRMKHAKPQRNLPSGRTSVIITFMVSSQLNNDS